MSEQAKGSWERVEALMVYHYDVIADNEEYRADLAMVKEHAAQVSALTEQRDAAVAACKAKHEALKVVEWVDVPDTELVKCPGCKAKASTYSAPELRMHYPACSVAAAIAMTEGAK